MPEVDRLIQGFITFVIHTIYQYYDALGYRRYSL
jgi:hypothetical protein